MARPQARPDAPRPRGRARKVAISLPAGLLEEVERRRRATGESRSRYVGNALVHFLRAADEAVRVREYVAGYRRMPESAEEVAESESKSPEAFFGPEPFGEEAWE